MRTRGGRAGRAGRVAALVAVTIAVAGWSPGPVGGQAPPVDGPAPVVSIVPDASTTPGEWFMFLVEGCTPIGDAPTISYTIQGQDITTIEEMVPNDVDAWHLEVQAPPTDVVAVAINGCAQGDADLGDGYVDVENPILLATPIGGVQAGGVIGTDCPDGATPEASLWLERTEVLLDPTAPDEHGDWSAQLPDASEAGAPVGEVHAVCGPVTYAVLPVDLEQAAETTTTTSSTTTTQPVGPAAAPATPVDGAARFTG